MKIHSTADCHLNKPLYKGVYDTEFPAIPFRNGDFMRSFRYSVDVAINDKTDLFAIVGDAYDNYEPLNPIRAFFNTQIKRLSSANIPVVILTGNHDVCSKHHALEPVAAMGLSNVQVISSPRLVSFKDKLLMLFPYAMEIENGTYTTKELFNNFLEHCKKKIAQTPNFQNKEILFFGHFGVKGAILNTYEDLTDINVPKEEKKEGKRKVFLNASSKDITIGDIDRLAEEIGVKYVVLGDYHRHQILPTKNCISFYTGSIEKSDFSEANDEKGFVIYDSEAIDNGKMGKCRFHAYPKSRPMVEINGNLQEILAEVDSLPSTIGTLVKIKFKGNEDQLREYSDAQKALEQKIKVKFDPIYTVASQELIDKKESEEAKDIEEDILNKDNLDDKDVLMVVHEAIREKIENKEEQNILIKMAEDMFKEVKGE